MKTKLLLIHVFTIFAIWFIAQYSFQAFEYQTGFIEYPLIIIAAAWAGARARNYFARRLATK